jgi:hypothetical protein
MTNARLGAWLYDGEHKPAHAWDIPALAGAGAIRSTAGDMLTYLEALGQLARDWRGHIRR